LSTFSTFFAAALASSAWLRAAIAVSPQRVVSFLIVEASGTRPPRGMRQKRDHDTQSVTSRHSASKPSLKFTKPINLPTMSLS